MSWQALINAFGYFGQLDSLAFVILGILLGIVIGIIPGIGGLMALAIFLPFTFQMNPLYGLPLMLAILATQFTGGAISSILINVPGTAPNAATLIDGFPMTRKGLASRALGASTTSSAMGGVFSVFLALAAVPLILPIILSIHTADMVFIILIGLTFIAVLGKGSMLKGLISGGLGLMLSFIGYQYATAVPRFTFGNLYLYESIPLIPLCIGMFGIPVVYDMAVSGASIAKKTETITNIRESVEGAKDVFRHWFLWLRCVVIGWFVGIIPGIGAEIATYSAYGHAKQTSKHPEKFGTGTVEGVIAPQAADNASLGGDLLVTLTLGIPGSSTMAIFIGALLMMGFSPGPEMMRNNLDLSLYLLLVIVFSNIAGGVICFFAAPKLAKLTTIPAHVLGPLVLVMTFVGTFVYRGYFMDMILAIIFSLLGMVMARFGYNRPALVIGYILGEYFEKYFWTALGVGGPLFFLRPSSLVLIGIMIVGLAFQPVKGAISRRRAEQLV